VEGEDDLPVSSTFSPFTSPREMALRCAAGLTRLRLITDRFAPASDSAPARTSPVPTTCDPLQQTYVLSRSRVLLSCWLSVAMTGTDELIGGAEGRGYRSSTSWTISRAWAWTRSGSRQLAVSVPILLLQIDRDRALTSA
jgi:hypothetical protein